ncbi:alpha/beta hydrolase [Diaminobutyricibacter tongyongensis]|uniref:Alpha/beta hydrolase n=1 Tax=Leifsonia tongyongensis TaxID=1268043 RepID=A0A6L9Y3J1_9MICO|nr:alpha/beta hydrolase [Diaminobutyricibacter tongyongensis]NEN08035.1 alpha/beta hydrolase [Diaminobutyricibacter tongyongensis]
MNSWVPDVLGDHFERRTIPLESDSEGEVVATLVRYRPAPRVRLAKPVAGGADVLYVHGWSDYFFQTQLAEFWHNAGARFFALDLRKYGRSLRPHQTPGDIADLAAYDEEMEIALEIMSEGEPQRRPLILMGHSTGGLILSLWADRHPGRVAALVLNSPWLEFQARGAGRAALAPLVGMQARLEPHASLPNVDFGFYTRSISSTMDGEWTYNLDWRPIRGFAVHPGWLNAVLAGHARIATGLSIDAPVLILLSAHSAVLPRWTPDMMRADSVLVVDDIAVRAVRLAPIVTVARLDGALHDVFLSAADVRADAYTQVIRWLRAYLPSR